MMSYTSLKTHITCSRVQLTSLILSLTVWNSNIGFLDSDFMCKESDLIMCGVRYMTMRLIERQKLVAVNDIGGFLWIQGKGRKKWTLSPFLND